MSNGTHVDLISIKTHSVTMDGPMSNLHISKSNNWHGRLVEGVRRRPQAHAFRSAVVSRPRLSSALGCEGGNGGPRIGRNMVVCMSVFVCVRVCVRVGQLYPLRPWQCCCNQASQGRLPAFFTPKAPCLLHTGTDTHRSDYLFNELFKV